MKRMRASSDLSNQEPNNRPTMNDLASNNPMPTAATPEMTLWRWLTAPVPNQWLLPATGLWIIGLDWLLFTQEAVSLGLATPLASAVGFVGGILGTHYFQTRYAGDRGPSAWIKSLLAGIVVGIPIPLAGSFVGGWILIISGLARFKDRLSRK
jgi:hypothetical protein